MKELGRILQTTRESKHLTLDEIQERTKIRKRYLQAIEEGDLSILPGLVYARGFIKSYADQLGLNGQTLLREHGLLEDVTSSSTTEVNQKPEKQHESIAKRTMPVSEQTVNMLPQVLMGVAIIGLLGVGYWYLSHLGSAPKSPVSPPPQQQPTPNQAPLPAPPAPAENVQKPAEPLQPETKTGNLSVYKVDGDKMKLNIETANGDCWLEIRVDGVKKYSQVAVKGTALSFEGSHEIQVTSGFSPALKVTVNGQTVELEQAKQRYDYRFLKR